MDRAKNIQLTIPLMPSPLSLPSIQPHVLKSPRFVANRIAQRDRCHASRRSAMAGSERATPLHTQATIKAITHSIAVVNVM